MNRSSYGLYLSSVLSIFSHNPIFVLGIIAYIAFSIIKSKNTEESDDYDNYESSSSGQTWEDMEREYGISIEKKPVEPSTEDLLYDDDFYREIFKNRPIENQHPEAPLRKRVEDCFNMMIRRHLKNMLKWIQAMIKLKQF